MMVQKQMTIRQNASRVKQQENVIGAADLENVTDVMVLGLIMVKVVQCVLVLVNVIHAMAKVLVCGVMALVREVDQLEIKYMHHKRVKSFFLNFVLLLIFCC
jgi:hypothetical protein